MSEVLKVEVFPHKNPHSKIVAFGKVTLSLGITIEGVKIINGPKGLFVGMPSTKSKEGTFSDIVYISNNKLKKEIQDKMLEAYSGSGAASPIEDTEEDFPF